jgi:hypothetical protein
MTAKEKAEELVDKMLNCYQGHIDEYTAKQCALIAVIEILRVAYYANDDIYNLYLEVKTEIEKI